MTLSFTEATYSDITGTDMSNTLQLQVLYFRLILELAFSSLQAIAENAAAPATTFDIGESIFIFVEEDLPSYIDVSLSDCYYGSDTVDSSLAFWINGYEDNNCFLTNSYTFDSKYSGVTIQVYDDSDAPTSVSCSAELSFNF